MSQADGRSTTRANPAKGCNVTCPVAGEITIRQPHLSEIDESVYMKEALMAHRHKD